MPIIGTAKNKEVVSMAENKQYITRAHEHGKIMISEDVVATIALQAMTDIEGFAGLTPKAGSDLAELLKINWSKNLKISISPENSVTVTCNVLIGYGFNIMDVAAEIQKNVTSEIQSVTGVTTVCVNVNICGIVRK